MWAGTTTVRVGGYHLGVRAFPEALHEAVQQFLTADADVAVDAPPNLSVRFDAPAVGAPSFVLYRAHRTVLSTRSPERLLYALRRFLEGLVQPAEHDRFPVATATAFVRDGAAVLGPAACQQRLPQLAPHLRRAGIACLEGLRPLIDPATAELVVRSEPETVNWEAAQLLRELAADSQAREPILPAGRYRIRCWLLPSVTDSRSLATRVAQVLPLLPGPGAQQRLELSARLMRRVRVGDVPLQGAQTIVARLSEELDVRPR